MEMAGKRDALSRYLSATTDIFEGFESELIGADHTVMQEHLERIEEGPLSPLSKLMLGDTTCLLPSNLLVKMDIATMANSLEGRSPFLSRDFVMFSPRLPDNLKVNGKTTKYLLRELSKHYLPNALPGQPKRGFEIPLKRWVEADLDEMIRSYLGHDAYSRHFINPAFLDALLEKKAPVPAEKRARMLWALLSLEVWQRTI